MKKILYFIDKIYDKYSYWINEYGYRVDWRAGSFDNFVGHYVRDEVGLIEGLIKLYRGDF